MKIINGRLQGARFVRANSFGGKMRDCTAIVLHDTAGRLDKFSSVNWFASKQCKTSAHFTIERDGTITQQVPTDCKAYHAGKSCWKGRSLCNGFTVGIEIVNPGLLKGRGDEALLIYKVNGQEKIVERFPLADCKKMKTKEHGDGYWLPYTPEQIKAVKELCRALVEEYHDCNEIVTHWMISPGRKIDTNPLLPLEDIRAYAFGQDDDADDDTPPAIAVEPEKPKALGFIIPAADGDSAAPVKDLAPVSRKVSVLKRTRGLLHVVWSSIAGLFTIENFGLAKGVVNDVHGMVQQLALPLGLAAAICGIFLIRYLLQRIDEDYASGRYTPSGSEG